MTVILTLRFWYFKCRLQKRDKRPWKPSNMHFRAIWTNNVKFIQKYPPYLIRHFQPWVRNQRPRTLPYIHFCAIWTRNLELSPECPTYWIRHFEFLLFDLAIVISGRQNRLMFIYMQFERKTSNLVKNGCYIESAISNFSIRTAVS